MRISSVSTDSSVVVSPARACCLHGESNQQNRIETHEVVSITRNTEYDMHFEDTNMNEIVRRVEGKFDVHIKLEDDDIRNCMISADFTDQSLSITLAMISEALGARYVIDGKQINISGTGCQK
ncbi:MAG: DUF4974 domain-containing protein [Bacteroidota bacterium]